MVLAHAEIQQSRPVPVALAEPAVLEAFFGARGLVLLPQQPQRDAFVPEFLVNCGPVGSWATDRVGAAGGGNNCCSSEASSSPSGNGQLNPATLARLRTFRMDNLTAGTLASFRSNGARQGISGLSCGDSVTYAELGCPACRGIGVRHAMESLSGLPWNTHHLRNKPIAPIVENMDDQLFTDIPTHSFVDEDAENAKPPAADRVEVAVQQWVNQLMDVTGRNNLLNLRMTKGTLDITDLEDGDKKVLLAGKSRRLGHTIVEDRRDDAIRRGRSIYKKAKENFEERGLETLFLAVGLATWTNTRGRFEPRAPVLLFRAELRPPRAGQSDFNLSLTDDVEVNPTLLHLLHSEFGVDADAEGLNDRIDGAIDEPWEVATVYDWLAAAANTVDGFKIDDSWVLANFSYAKLPMVKDLEGNLEWLAKNEVIASLAGDANAQEALRSRHVRVSTSLPDATPPADEYLVLDADSSQNYAINAVLAGGDIIVKGPPGTGKSQTIANLIATLLARDKTVLFVAEKRAAIEAVVKRLDQCQLSNLVLDLHGGIGSRRQFARHIQSALDEAHRTSEVDADELFRQLETSRRALSERCKALHERREPWGVSMFDAQVECLRVAEPLRSRIRLVGEDLCNLNRAEFLDAKQALQELAGLGAFEGDWDSKPWVASAVSGDEDAKEAQEATAHLRGSVFPSLRRAVDLCAGQAMIEAPKAIGELRELAHSLAEARDLITRIKPQAFALDTCSLDVDLAPFAGSSFQRIWTNLFNGSAKRARDEMQAVAHAGVRLETSELPELSRRIGGVAAVWSRYSRDERDPRVPPALNSLISALEQLDVKIAEIGKFVAIPNSASTLDAIETWVDDLHSDSSTLPKLPRVRMLEQRLAARNLGPVLDEARDNHLNAHSAREMLSYIWHYSIIDRTTMTDPVVSTHGGRRLDETVERFRKCDANHIEHTTSRIRRICAERALRACEDNPEQARVVEKQAALKRRHMAPRQLVERAREVLIGVKPCWVMSPLMVSQVLPRENSFDVVIFDEASQVTPADAVPAIARGAQLVVAGDEHQLPPTAFFASGRDDEGDEEVDEDIGTRGFESVLEALQPVLAWRRLSWHYRSRDERLIAFSNWHIYSGSMVTFPGVMDGAPIDHELVPFDPRYPTFKGSSPMEVKRVVEMILDHVRKRPDESLGVIAMGTNHASRIDAELLNRLRSLEGDAEIQEFFDETREERFFVKNLERVQGDERDAIILSIGYGKDGGGRLSYRFGPLNTAGGERRLNVAVTRAKLRTSLVTSFGSVDMEEGRSSARGVELLREYLVYAESRGADLGSANTLDEPLNAFELDVQSALEAHGISMKPQHGCSGYRIDFAARHPERPGGYVLAIECDGASYHSSPTARDRDRLRQDHLERLGWRFHRIWSTDWFRDRDAEIDRAVSAFKHAVAASERDYDSKTTEHDAAGSMAIPTVKEVVRERGNRPPCKPGAPIGEHSHRTLVQLAQWIASDGKLRTKG